MLESLLRAVRAEKDPKDVFIIAIIFSFVAVGFAVHLFPAQASVFAVSLITIMFVPMFQKLFEIEEKKDYKLHKDLLKRHRDLFFVFGSFFLGIIVAMSFIYVFFPDTRNAFAMQESWYKANGREIITANAAAQDAAFWSFFINNSQVMLMMFLLSVIFGGGAIFILAWNASVIAVYVGFVINSFIRIGVSPELAYILGVPAGVGSIALHGVPEILAYFVAALAGGMLSVGIIRERLKGHFDQIFKDSLLFLGGAEALIIIAALLEAYV
jgi:uncharacterized membrane protein SpoIIM required for sporulation